MTKRTITWRQLLLGAGAAVMAPWPARVAAAAKAWPPVAAADDDWLTRP
jgi:hypothetical protein